MHSKKRVVKGFTLVELMVVISVIAILAMVVLVSLSGARELAEDTNRMTAISQLRSFFYVETKVGDIDFNDLSTIGGGAGEVICEYGQPGDVNSLNCPARGLLVIEVDLTAGEYCASIELLEKDGLNRNKYFCVDKNLALQKYESDGQPCGVTAYCQSI